MHQVRPFQWTVRTIYRDGSVPISPGDGYYEAFFDFWNPIYERRRLELHAPEESSPGVLEPFNRQGFAVLFNPDPGGIFPSGWNVADKCKQSVDNFKSRCLDGEIVINDYYVLHAYGAYSPFIREGQTWWAALEVHVDLGTLNIGADNGVLWINGTRYHGQITFGYEGVPMEVVKHPMEDGLTGDLIVKTIGGLRPTIDPARIQATLDKANAGTLDLLTSLAELPETLISIKDLCASILEMFKAAKKRELSLTKQNEKRKVRHAEKVRSVEQELSAVLEEIRSIRSSRLSKSDRIKLSRLRRKKRNLSRKRNNLYKEFREFMTEFTSALADIWMNYRYNIKTNQYMIEDIIKTFEDYKQEFVRTRDGYKQELKLPDIGPYAFKGTATCDVRCFIKRSYKFDSLFDNLNTVLRANLAVTAWELVKRSFVIDWIFTIGDAISALLYDTRLHLQEGACISYQIAVTGEYTYDSGGTSVDYRSYERQKINPADSIGIYFRPDIDFVRQLDAASMIWGAFRKKVEASNRGLK